MGLCCIISFFLKKVRSAAHSFFSFILLAIFRLFFSLLFFQTIFIAILQHHVWGAAISTSLQHLIFEEYWTIFVARYLLTSTAFQYISSFRLLFSCPLFSCPKEGLCHKEKQKDIMNNVHLKFMASLLQNEIKQKGKR